MIGNPDSVFEDQNTWKCPECDGRGRVSDGEGHGYTCPLCDGECKVGVCVCCGDVIPASMQHCECCEQETANKAHAPGSYCLE